MCNNQVYTIKVIIDGGASNAHSYTTNIMSDGPLNALNVAMAAAFKNMPEFDYCEFINRVRFIVLGAAQIVKW